MTQSGGLVMAFLVLFWVFLGGSADAATLTVCSSACSYTTIKSAYNASSATGDTIDVTDSRTYTERFDISKNITIQSSATTPATWKGSGGSNIFKVKSAKTVRVEGFILEPVSDHAVEMDGGSTLTLNNVTIDGFTDTGKDGVGVEVSNSSTLTVENSTFNNLRSRNGGAIYAETGSNVTITNCVFDGNSSTTEGGSVFVWDGTLIVSGTSFINSTAGGWGGTIYVEDTDLSVSSSTFGTSVTTGGGSNGGHIAAYSDDWTLDDVTISNSTFTNGTSTNEGGALYAWYANVTVSGGAFTNNYASGDGGDGNRDQHDHAVVNGLHVFLLQDQAGGRDDSHLGGSVR